MAVEYRVGTHKDIKDIAQYMQMSAGGLSDFLLDGISHDCEVHEFIELAVADETTNIFYKNTLVADDGGEIEGMINFYPGQTHALPDIMYSVLSQDKLDLVVPIFKDLPENSIYIYSLACNPDYGKTNVFVGLMLRAFRYARTHCFSTVCAHVWPNNTKFLNFLLKAGGSISHKIPVKPMAQFDFQSEIYLLRYDVSGRVKNDA